MRGWGVPQFLERAEPLKSKEVLANSKVLTVASAMRNNRQRSIKAVLCRRLWNSSAMVQEILTSEIGPTSSSSWGMCTD